MTYQIKNKYLFLVIIGALLACFLLGGYLARQRGDRALDSLSMAYNNEILQYKYRLDSLEKVASQRDQEITTLRQAIKNGDVERAELRKINLRQVNEITKLKVAIDTLIHIQPPDGTVVQIVYVDKQPKPALLLPYTFKDDNKHFNISGTFNTKAELSLAIKMTANLDVWVGTKDKKPSVVVTSDNPFLNLSNVKSIKFDKVKPKKWGVGLQAGYALILDNNPRFSPILGVGVSRNVIRF